MCLLMLRIFQKSVGQGPLHKLQDLVIVPTFPFISLLQELEVTNYDCCLLLSHIKVCVHFSERSLCTVTGNRAHNAYTILTTNIGLG